MFNTGKIIWHLQQKNEKAYYLAFLRVALSIWCLKELLFRWPAFEMLYSNHSFIKVAPASSLYLFRINPSFLREHYMTVIYICIVLLVLNIFGIGRNVVSFLLFLTLRLLNSINDKFGNSGDEMAMLLAFYLSFANTFSHFTLFKQKILPEAKQKIYNLVSNIAAYSIMINLCLVYFMSCVYKAADPLWLNGTAMHYFLNYERHSIFATGKYITMPMILVYALTYGTLLFEFSFPFLVWQKKSRNIVLLTGVIMHSGIYIFLMIYAMSIIFIMQYGLFFSNEEVIACVEKLKKFTKWSKQVPVPN